MNSDAVHFGRNRDLAAFRDDHYVRCARCGFICNTDRDRRDREGSRSGEAITDTAQNLSAVGSITAFADYSSTVSGTTLVTDATHGLSTGDTIIISGTTSYNGQFSITNVGTDTFYIKRTFVATETGTWTKGKVRNITAVADYSSTVSGTVKVTSSAHGLYTSNSIVIVGTTDYNGTFSVTKIDVDSFYITETYTSSQTGTWTPYIYDPVVNGGCPQCGCLMYTKE